MPYAATNAKCAKLGLVASSPAKAQAPCQTRSGQEASGLKNALLDAAMSCSKISWCAARKAASLSEKRAEKTSRETPAAATMSATATAVPSWALTTSAVANAIRSRWI